MELKTNWVTRYQWRCRWALLFLVLMVLAFIGTGCQHQEITIDMQDTVTSGSSAGEITPATKDELPPLRIAVAAMISPQTTRKYYQELLGIIAHKVGRKAEFSQRRTYAEVNDLVANQQVDLAFVCAGPYVTGHKEFGMELLVVPVVHKKSHYHSYIIVPTASRATCFADLRGKSFAFTDPNSNTGCLVPTYMLARMDETPQSFFASSFFTHSHDNTIAMVAAGKVDGGAVDSLIWEFMKTIDPQLVKKTRIVEQSSPFGIPPVVVNPKLSPQLKQRLREIFLTLHQDPQIKEILNKLQIDRFDLGEDQAYDSVREMQLWVAKQKAKSA